MEEPTRLITKREKKEETITFIPLVVLFTYLYEKRNPNKAGGMEMRLKANT